MRRSSPAVGLGLGLAGLLAIACNALTGVGDLVVDGMTSDGGLGDAPPSIDAPTDTRPAFACPAAGRSCAPALIGWEGPFLVFRGPADKPLPSCPSEMPTARDENVGEPAGTIACSECSCGDVKGSTCTVGLAEFTNPNCPVGGVARTKPLTTSSCLTPTPGEPYSSARPIGTIGQAGLCDAFVPPTGKVKSEVTWSEVLRTCRKDGDFSREGCKNGELCVPDGAPPFKTHICIRRADYDAECPDGFPEKIETVRGVDDTRDCSTDGCSCGAPQNVGCTATTHHFATADCTGSPASLVLGACVNTTLGSSSQRLLAGTLAATGGSCTPSGTPTATGGVAKTSARNVVCCLP